MPEFWEKLLFDDTKRRIGSGSTDFLTEDELKFIGRRADGMFIDFTRGVPGVDVEVDAHEMQFVLERILGMKAGKIRNSFEGIDKVNARYSTKLFRKADYLFSNPYKNHPDRYKVRSNMEYNEEFNE